MHIYEHSAFAMAMALHHPANRALPEFGLVDEGTDCVPAEGTWVLDKGERVVPQRKQFDRSKVFMICMENYDDFKRLSVTMLGGHRFEIDSNQVAFNLDDAADWLMGAK